MKTTLRAFTLVELMIAMALGLVVSATIFAGLRLAASCVTTADRLATQNQLITAAMLRLSDELDSWNAFDDGTDAQADALDAAGRGKPFGHLAHVWSTNGVQNAWGDDPWKWSAAEPASWWRGCLAERYQNFWAVPRFGYYGISGASVPSSVVPAYAGYGQPPQPTTDSSAWLYDQQRGLCLALGFYGMADYLPANAIMGWYGDTVKVAGPNSGWPTGTGFPAYMQAKADESWGGQMYNRCGAATPTPQSLYQATYNGIFSILSPHAARPITDLAGAIDRNRWAYYSWEGASDDVIRKDVADLIARDEAVAALMPVAPAHWPNVDARILRTLHKAYFTNLCTIGWLSPVTGERSELRFTGFGTTLRGARIQRGLDPTTTGSGP